LILLYDPYSNYSYINQSDVKKGKITLEKAYLWSEVEVKLQNIYDEVGLWEILESSNLKI